MDRSVLQAVCDCMQVDRCLKICINNHSYVCVCMYVCMSGCGHLCFIGRVDEAYRLHSQLHNFNRQCGPTQDRSSTYIHTYIYLFQPIKIFHIHVAISISLLFDSLSIDNSLKLCFVFQVRVTCSQLLASFCCLC